MDNNAKLKRILKKLSKYENIVVYGAGGIGRKVSDWLKLHNITCFIFAVSNRRQNPKNIDGITVKQIDELNFDRAKTIVIVATLPKLHKEIEDILNSYGYENRIFVKDNLLRNMGVVQVNGIYPNRFAQYYEKINNITRIFFKRLSCKNIIIFESKIDYTDNCRALSEYIEENLPNKYKIVWILKNPKLLMQKKKIICISRYQISTINIIRLNYYLARAKFVFFTHPGWLYEWKKEQRVINLGHGNPLKRADEPNGHVADCVLASGEDGIKYRKLEYKNDISVEVLGPPRNDWLFRDNHKVIAKYLSGGIYNKIIFCFPTYKQYDVDLGNLKKIKYDSHEENQFCLNTINTVGELIEFNEILKRQKVLLICKEHYLQKKNESESLSNIVYIDDNILQSNGHDLYHLIGCADAMLTDFSSIYMDYLLLDRPVGFFCNTTEQYERGFALENPEKYMPGEKIYDNQGLKEFVMDVVNNQDKYKAERKIARDLIFKFQDNQNCKRCIEYFNL